MQIAAFQCLRCGHITLIRQDSLKLEEPFAGCEDETCGKKGPFRLLIEESTYTDAQEIEIFDYANDGYKYEAQRTVQLKVILIGDAVGKTHLEQKFKFSGKLVASEPGRSKLEYLLYAEAVEVIPTVESRPNNVSDTDISTVQRNKIKILKDIIKSISENYPGHKAPLEEIYTEAEKVGIDRALTDENIKKMKQRGDLLSPDQSHIRLVA